MNDQSPPRESSDYPLSVSETEDVVTLDRRTIADAFSDLATPANLMLAGLLAVLLLTGLLGGWNNLAERQKTIPAVELDKEVEASPFKISVRKGFWFDNIPKLYRLKDGQRALLVTVDVTNMSERFVDQSDAKIAFRLDNAGLVDPILNRHVAPGKAAPEMLRGSDSFVARSLQPGLPARLALIWIQDASYPAPEQLNLVISKQNYRASSLDGSMQYFDETPAYRISIPIAEMKVGT